MLSGAVPAGRVAAGFVFADVESVDAFDAGSILGGDPGSASEGDVGGGGVFLGGFTV